MFKKEREFNIISGETTNYASQRSFSCAQQRQHFMGDRAPLPKPLKLGEAKDRKEFKYDYAQDPPAVGTRVLTQNDGKAHFLPSMVNSTNTNYNIITHK
jgi:hypothetical protein